MSRVEPLIEAAGPDVIHPPLRAGWGIDRSGGEDDDTGGHQ